jgi:hypothetical protein
LADGFRNKLENIPMSHPDFSSILDTASTHASANAHLPSLIDLVPQGLPSHDSGSQAPNSHSQADLHVAGGILDVAPTHTDVTLPDVVSLTGHDWFVHT